MARKRSTMDKSHDLQTRTVVAGSLSGPSASDQIGMVSPSRLASFWGVHPNTIYRDIRKGALRAFRLPSGQLRISRKDARQYGRPTE
jgi:IS30 family transposase